MAWLGILVAVLIGGISALLHAVVTASFQANQVVSGLALTMLGLGVSGLWGKSFIEIPLSTKISAYRIPLLGRIPILGDILFYQDAFFYLSILLGIPLWFFFSHTRWGIYIRSVGENPIAAESQGVSVALTRYLCVIGGGACGSRGGLQAGRKVTVYLFAFSS